MRTIFGSGLLFLVCFVFACNLKPAIRSNEGALQTKSDSAEEPIPSDQAVDFEGVSFRYDPSVFGDVTKEVVPEHRLEAADQKPEGVGPRHVRFMFELGEEYNKAELLVFAIDEFPGAYGVDSESVEHIKKESDALRKVLKDPTYRLDGDIPHLPFEDVAANFYVKVREFDFQNGDGVLFVTHWEHGVDFISNRNLLYRFEGLTADGKFYVTAEMPVSVGFLPDNPSEFEGYTEKDLTDLMANSNGATAKHEAYIKSIATRLEKLNSNDYSPALEKFEAVISSLSIKR